MVKNLKSVNVVFEWSLYSGMKGLEKSMICETDFLKIPILSVLNLIFFSGCLPNLLFTCEPSIVWKRQSQMVSRGSTPLSKCTNHFSWNQIRLKGRQRNHRKTKRKEVGTYYVPTSEYCFTVFLKGTITKEWAYSNSTFQASKIIPAS